MSRRDHEYELESMGELEDESEWEGMGEAEDEFEYEGEGEDEGEEFLGTVARGLGSLLGESELEGEYEGELEFEGEFESEEFFRRIGGFLRRAAPILRNVARVAAPIVGRAVGGALGGPAGMALGGQLGSWAQRALSESELEGEFELEGEWEEEGEEELEGEWEAVPMTHHEALAEFMAAVSAQAQTEAEAEAMAGAATTAMLSRSDRAALRRILPHMVRGTAILTRILRRRRITRPAVRVVPTIVRRSTQILTRRAAAGQPITRRTAARVMANQTRRVLSSPRICGAAMRRNMRATRTVARRSAQPVYRRQRRITG